VKFVVDAQLPPLLAQRLTDQGHPSVHLLDRLHPTARDRAVAELANELGAAVVSKDADFVALRERGVLHLTFVWVRCGNVDRNIVCDLIATRLPDIVKAAESGALIIEIR
jgi:predicted nuclease of predicted toxin-antitoxin system